MRTLTSLTLVGLFGTLLILAFTGCSNDGSGFAAVSPVNPAPGMSRVYISVNWPTRPGRLVSTQFFSVAIKITGTGMADVTGTIPYGQSTPMAFNVPAGSNRTFTAMGRDEAQQDLVGGKTTLTSLSAGSTVNVTIPIIGLQDPANDSATTPTAITLTGGVGKILDIIDSKYSDRIDNLSFTGVAGKEYTVTLTESDSASGGPLVVTVYDPTDTAIATINPDTGTHVGSTIFTIPAGNTATTYRLAVGIDPNAQAGVDTRILYRVDVAESATVNVGVD